MPPKKTKRQLELELAQRKASFLAAYQKHGTIVGACKQIKVAPATVAGWRKGDELFAAQFRATQDLFVQELETEARRRAVEGWDEPVWFQGEMVGTIRKFSDTLLIFLLKANRPEKYRDSFKIELVTPESIDAEIERQKQLLRQAEAIEATSQVVDLDAHRS